MSFDWQIIGHERIKDFLEQSARTDRLHHAYLFSGPESVGKMALASVFVQSLLCEHSENKSSIIPCRKCSACKAFANGSHPDVVFIKDDNPSIGINEARQLIGGLSRTMFLGKYHVAIIDHADRLTEDAQNALLKTLEESKERKIFILITERQLLPTIHSRSQLIKFFLVQDDCIEEALLERGLTRPEAQEIASLACGRPGVAFNFLRDEKQKTAFKSDINDFVSLFEETGKFNSFAFELLGRELSESRKRFGAFYKAGLNVFRAAILLRVGLPGHINYFLANKAETISKNFSLPKMMDLFKELEFARRAVAANADPRLVLENFYLQIHD